MISSLLRVEIILYIVVLEAAREITKSLMRESTLKKLLDTRDNDKKFFVDSTLKHTVQEPLGKYLEALKKKKFNK